MPQVNAPPTPRDRKILRELDELAERQGFVHHVADAASGRIVTPCSTGRRRRCRGPSDCHCSATRSIRRSSGRATTRR